VGRRSVQRVAAIVSGLGLAFLVVPGVCASGVGAVERATTSTTVPVDYGSALSSRLAKEYGDPALAKEVVAGLSPASLANLEQRVPLTDVAKSPFLAYRPKRIAASAVDSLFVYAFGNRVAADGTITSGPTNAALAAATRKFVKKHPVPVFAQREIAQQLQAGGVKNVTSIDPIVGADGKVTYLSTAGVAAQAKDKAKAAGINLGTVGVIAFADHAMRAVLTTDAAGLRAAVPKGVVLPSTYDAKSGQPWTRDRQSYLPTDLLGRLATL